MIINRTVDTSQNREFIIEYDDGVYVLTIRDTKTGLLYSKELEKLLGPIIQLPTDVGNLIHSEFSKMLAELNQNK